MRAGKGVAALLVAAAVAAAAAGVSAHRYDEYLHASRIALAPGSVRIEMSLTPGMAVADAVIGEIDTNRDAVLSVAERQAYAQRVLGGLSLRLDDAVVPLTLMESIVPAAGALRGGDRAITVVVGARLPSAAGSHRLSFRNANVAHGAVYLANALVPEDERVSITGMTHAVDQSGLTVVYMVRPERSWSQMLRGILGPV